jgi:rhodanese-related sulfurtransferase
LWYWLAVLTLIVPHLGAAATRPATGPATRPAGYRNLTVEAFDRMRLDKEKKAIVLDVRTRAEFERGHIPGAVLIDVADPDFEKKIRQLDKQKVYLVHCATGRRSVVACERMKQAEFPHLFNLLGGFKAWQKEARQAERRQ